MGIATANSILLVSFAREGLAAGLDSASAALEAGFTRFRPVLMTALAMIIGMLPMAFALGEGGEQNAPLGRAVIGGLLVATLATLFFVPTVFSVLHRQRDHGPSDRPEAPQAEATALQGEPSCKRLPSLSGMSLNRRLVRLRASAG
jgi:Cu/Ag efflux pump CusA